MLEFDRSLVIIIALISLFVWTLKRTLLIPLLGIIRGRETKINSAQEAKTQSESRFSERERQYREHIRSARSGAALIREEEQQAGNVEREAMLAEARRRGEEKQQNFSRELEGQRQKLMGALDKESHQLSESICRLLLEP